MKLYEKTLKITVFLLALAWVAHAATMHLFTLHDTRGRK